MQFTPPGCVLPRDYGHVSCLCRNPGIPPTTGGGGGSSGGPTTGHGGKGSAPTTPVGEPTGPTTPGSVARSSGSSAKSSTGTPRSGPNTLTGSSSSNRLFGIERHAVSDSGPTGASVGESASSSIGSAMIPGQVGSEAGLERTGCCPGNEYSGGGKPACGCKTNDCAIKVSCAAIEMFLGWHPDSWESRRRWQDLNSPYPKLLFNENRRQVSHCWVEVRHCGSEEWERYEITYPERTNEEIAVLNKEREASKQPRAKKLGAYLYKNINLPGEDIGAGYKVDVYSETFACDQGLLQTIYCDCITEEKISRYRHRDTYNLPLVKTNVSALRGENSNTFAQALINYCRLPANLPGGWDTPGSGWATPTGDEFIQRTWCTYCQRHHPVWPKY